MLYNVMHLPDEVKLFALQSTQLGGKARGSTTPSFFNAARCIEVPVGTGSASFQMPISGDVRAWRSPFQISFCRRVGSHLKQLPFHSFIPSLIRYIL